MTETRVGSASCGCEQKRWMVFVIMMMSCQSADEMELNGRDEERRGMRTGDGVDLVDEKMNRRLDVKKREVSESYVQRVK